MEDEKLVADLIDRVRDNVLDSGIVPIGLVVGNNIYDRVISNGIKAYVMLDTEIPIVLDRNINQDNFELYYNDETFKKRVKNISENKL